MQAPGRLLRGRERPITRAADLAAALLPVVASRLGAGVPYVVRVSRHVLTVWLHSFGVCIDQLCWLSVHAAALPLVALAIRLIRCAPLQQPNASHLGELHCAG